MSAEMLHGDCRDVMATLAPASVDAIVCDPPYGLSFMGKGWDHGVPSVEFWTAALRVAKPGAYLVAFGGTRTYHRLACAIEDAGWEIHDCLSWLYGSGFPKHASKLKPGWEPAILARKPAPRATPLQIDACRIGTGDDRSSGGAQGTMPQPMSWGTPTGRERPGGGRWPANVLLDEDAAGMLDAQSGERGSFLRADVPGKDGGWPGGTRTVTTYGDTGGASRFFYCAKASRKERNAGLDDFPLHERGTVIGQLHEGVSAAGNRTGRYLPRANNHPTVKPLAVMRWLVRLVTPPGGLVLDPFTGSGSTGVACVQEGYRFVGIEREAEYVAIAEARLRHAQQAAQPSLLEVAS